MIKFQIVKFSEENGFVNETKHFNPIRLTKKEKKDFKDV